MVSIKTKYIILIWLIILILFTFYCVFRLKFLKEKYFDTPKYTYFNNNNNTPIIALINTVARQDKITNVEDPAHCKKLYDDNILVQSLGYNNCESAYADYLEKGFDTNNNYGQTKSLTDICPIATKSGLYTLCLTSLLNNFTNNATLIDGVATDMASSINKRLQYRSGVLDNIQNQMNPLIFNKDQNDFNNYMKENKSVAKYQDDVIQLVDNYYQDKYQNRVGYTGDDTAGSTEVNTGFNNKEGFIARTSVYIMDPELQKLFFGNYKPINGQFIAFSDLTISLGYDGPTPTIEQKQIPNKNMSSGSSPTSAPSPVSNPYQENSGLLNQINNIVLTISSKSNNLSIAYNIVNIDNYKSLANTIKIIISKQTILSNTNDAGYSQTILQLLSTLGITSPMQLIMSYEEYTSTSGTMHKTYKLINDNLETILLLYKY